METPIALHSVAHRVSHQIPAESEMSRQNRATPPQIKVSHLSPDPPVALSSHSQQAGGAAGWWRVSRHFWVLKTDRATGGIAATVTPVALLFVFKHLGPIQVPRWGPFLGPSWSQTAAERSLHRMHACDGHGFRFLGHCTSQGRSRHEVPTENGDAQVDAIGGS